MLDFVANLKIGALVDVYTSDNCWVEAEVLAIERGLPGSRHRDCFVNYLWSSSRGERWVSSMYGRIAPLGTFTYPMRNLGYTCHPGCQCKAMTDNNNALVICKYQSAEIFKYETLADAGNAFAQCALGIAYAHGIGVAKNTNLAVDWYEKSAACGFPRAQTFLAKCFENGIGVAKNVPKALTWHRKAAEADVKSSQKAIRELYSRFDEVSAVLDRDLCDVWMLHNTILSHALFPLKPSDRPSTKSGDALGPDGNEMSLKIKPERMSRRFTKFTLVEKEEEISSRCNPGCVCM